MAKKKDAQKDLETNEAKSAEQEIEKEETQKADEEASKIEELEKDLKASKDAHIRTLAEYDNYRKRSTREKEAAYGDSKAACLAELLPVLDNFERAFSVEETDIESYKKGVEMIYNNLFEILKKLGVEAFGEKGETFDPNIHNGVMHVDDDELPENVIADVFSKGYKIGERILRPAMVKVAN